MKLTTCNSIRALVLMLAVAIITVSGFGSPVLAQTDEIPGYVRIHLEKVMAGTANSGYVIGVEKLDFDSIMDLLGHEDNRVASAAVYALGEIRNPEAVPALILALKSDRDHMRRIAAHALGKIGDRQAVSPLIDLLSDKNQPVAVQVSAIMSLGRIGDPEAELILTYMHCSPQNWLHKSANVALLKIDAGQSFRVASIEQNAISK